MRMMKMMSMKLEEEMQDRQVTMATVTTAAATLIIARVAVE